MGITLTPDELASVGGVAGKLRAINERYRVLFENIAQAFETAGVKRCSPQGLADSRQRSPTSEGDGIEPMPTGRCRGRTTGCTTYPSTATP